MFENMKLMETFFSYMSYHLQDLVEVTFNGIHGSLSNYDILSAVISTPGFDKI